MRDEVKTGLLAHLGAYAFLYLALMTPPSVLPHKKLALIFLPLVLACDIYSWKIGLGILAAVHGLWATELLLFRNPREDFKLLHFETPKPKENARGKDMAEEKNESFSGPWKEPFPSPIWQRFVWVTKLLQSVRYISWDTGSISSSRKPTPTSKQSLSSWLLQQTLFIAFCLLLEDVTNLYMHYDPYFQILTPIDEALPRRLGFFFATYHLDFLPPRAVRILVMGSHQYAIFSLMGSVPAVVMVLLGRIGVASEFWGRKENYLPWMGNPLVVLSSGLRGVWGKFWHQLFREMFLGPSNALITILHIPPSSIFASAFRVLVAFIVSGFLHAATLPRGIPGISPFKYAMFFWVHGIFVLFEMAVEHLLQHQIKNVEATLLGKTVLGLVRLVWVGSVLWWMLPTLADQLVMVTRIMGQAPVLFFPVKM